jgi:GT2 family glycosyltransferase
MAGNPLVSIIIVNFNGMPYLKKCFDSLQNGTYKNIEIIFVDNGSGDESIKFIKENYPHTLIIDNKANLGLSIASNRGAERAGGKYLFFYNNDTISSPDLIEILVNKMDSDSLIGICGCKTYTYDGRSIINDGVSCDIFGYPYGKERPFYVDAAIFIRNDLFYKLGGFDEKMFLYGEDRDLCWRCWLYGYKVVVVPDAIFYHNSACTTEDLKHYRTNIHRRFCGEYNSLRSILKNYSLGFLYFILPLFLVINISEILIFLLKGKFQIIRRVYIKSYIENLKDLKDILRKRYNIQRERKISDFALIRHMDKLSGKLRLFLDMGVPKFSPDAKYGKG